MYALLAGCLLAAGCGGSNARDRPLNALSEADRTMLQQYETIRAALAMDDFRAVKRTATGIQKTMETTDPSAQKPPLADIINKLVGASGLEAQRDAFRTWSKQVIAQTKDVQGFYTIHCPLPDCGDWVQKDAKVDNPYMGKSMRDCGEVKK